MKFAVLIPGTALALLAGIANAQGITARNADAVQPRNAGTIQPRAATAVPVASQADAVSPRYAPMVASTAVQGQRPSAWRWQTLGNTEVAGEGVARGSQLTDIRCAGLACRAYQDSAGAWVIRAEGGFPEAAGRTLEVRLMNTRTRQPQADSRNRGIFSDGSFRDQIDTDRLPPGSYAVFYLWNEKDHVFASVTFDVLRHAGTSTGERSGTGMTSDNRRALRETALQNQRCLTLAINSDIRCTP